RVFPLQRALIKDAFDALNLAIWAGASDVRIIYADDFGVRSSAEEGLRACNSSDYAIANLRSRKHSPSVIVIFHSFSL
ncbi:hypothetical protein SISNIDRAFT_421023, partial [Sistotremastrum niveocremeum HHB9708]